MGVAEAGGWSVPEPPGQQTEFRVSLGNLMRPRLQIGSKTFEKGYARGPGYNTRLLQTRASTSGIRTCMRWEWGDSHLTVDLSVEIITTGLIRKIVENRSGMGEG